MLAVTDHYEVLGVDSEATQDEIRKAYRARAMRWHPDKWCTEPEADRRAARVRFEQVQEAYEQLRVPEKRTAVDRALASEAIVRPSQSSSTIAAGQSPIDSYVSEVARELKEALENAASAKTPNRRRYWMNKAESWERILDPIISMITNPATLSAGSTSKPSRTTRVKKVGGVRAFVMLAIIIAIAAVATAFGLTGPTSAR